MSHATLSEAAKRRWATPSIAKKYRRALANIKANSRQPDATERTAQRLKRLKTQRRIPYERPFPITDIK